MKTIKEAIDAYLKKGFGSMNKNDFEVWIFNQLLESDIKGKSNHEISRMLRIPESKVKRLMYEADLKYVDEVQLEAERIEALDNLLKNAKVKRNGMFIQFSVENPAMRKYLEHQLKKNNSFSDSSFNTEIVTVNLEDYEALLRMTDTDGKQIEKLLKEARKLFNDNNLTLKEVRSKLIGGFLEGVGNGIGGLSLSGLFHMLPLLG